MVRKAEDIPRKEIVEKMIIKYEGKIKFYEMKLHEYKKELKQWVR